MLIRCLRASLTAGLALAFSVSNSYALTGTEFSQKMNKDQRTAYLDGVVETLMYTNRGISECILNWYYRGTPAENAKSAEEVIGAIHANPELPVSGIVSVLVKRHCSA